MSYRVRAGTTRGMAELQLSTLTGPAEASMAANG